jgi:Fe-S cluster biogenesis protein NfuA
VGNDGAFQDQIRQLGKLIVQLDQFPDGPQKSACKELVQLLMDIHGIGLERMMEIVFEVGNHGSEVIDKLAKDPVVGSLLLLYSLHPDDLETRVRKAMENMRPRLRKLSCSADVLRVEDGAVQVQVTTTAHGCSSSTKDVRAIVEDCVYEFAPDVVALEILGLEEPSRTGFVALDSLLGNGLPMVASNAHSVQTHGAH